MPNAGQTTLGAVRTAARQRADMVVSQFVTDSEFNGYINASYQELFGLLVQKFGDDYYVANPYSFTTDGIAEQFALPDGSAAPTTPAVFKLLGVEVQISANVWSDVPRFNFGERNRGGISQQGAGGLGGRTNLRYKLNGSNIWLRAGGTIPSAGQILRLWYVPRLTALSADADVLDGVNGWEEYVIVDAARKAKVKEESDTSELAVDKAALIARIEAEAENRDVANAATVTDVRTVNNGWDGFTPGGWD